MYLNCFVEYTCVCVYLSMSPTPHRRVPCVGRQDDAGEYAHIYIYIRIHRYCGRDEVAFSRSPFRPWPPSLSDLLWRSGGTFSLEPFPSVLVSLERGSSSCVLRPLGPLVWRGRLDCLWPRACLARSARPYAAAPRVSKARCRFV